MTMTLSALISQPTDLSVSTYSIIIKSTFLVKITTAHRTRVLTAIKAIF
jgi:hypothetical protein